MASLSEALNQIVDKDLTTMLMALNLGIPMFRGMHAEIEVDDEQIRVASNVRNHILAQPELVYTGVLEIGRILARSITREA